MLFRAQVRTVALGLLSAAATSAGATVEGSKDNPIQGDKPTASIVLYVDDTKQGIGVSPPQFSTRVTMSIAIRVEGKSKAEAESKCDTLSELVENTLLGSPAFVGLFEAIESVDSQTDYNATEGKRHAFSADIDIVAHTTEIFEPTIDQALTGINLYVDSVNIFDATGDYTGDEPFDVAAPPRAQGPDGRPEVSANIDLPQE